MPKATARTTRRQFFEGTLVAGADVALLASLGLAQTALGAPEADRLVVLTFDDAVKTHRTLVAPLLKEHGFGATFFVTHRWMVDDPKNYLTWQEIAEIHQMGFEIGNHSWTHPAFVFPIDAGRLAAELALVEHELGKVGVPRPKSFAWCGNAFGPEAIRELEQLGYQLARRGMQPEVEFGRRFQNEIGPLFDPHTHHRFLIPTTGDANPDWTLEHFQNVVERSRKGVAVVLQFHGVPDPHPWVNTTPERFRDYMEYLKHGDFKVISFQDLQTHLSLEDRPADQLLDARQPEIPKDKLVLPTEMQATRAELPYWLENMVRHHRFTWSEAAQVTGLDVEALKARAKQIGLDPSQQSPGTENAKTIRVLPYPGGRHPRKGYGEGAILPQRGTKVSIFSAWDQTSYVVVDLPEAIFSNLGLTYLAHTHIPTIWDERNIWLENVDWERKPDGSLSRQQRLPNRITFGAKVRPSVGLVEMELRVRNDSSQMLTGLRTQICVMLAGAPDFSRQNNDDKLFRSPVASVRSATGDRWILTAWDRCGRAWGNPPVPCLHSDPVLPDCSPEQEVRVRGQLWFYEGNKIETELERVQNLFDVLPSEGKRP
ncbi:MAG TPA: polysaccharide deacetylase family protein [Pirellulales bacterium]|nr:polysaccharide deacetylase family protein [Pirellulales bacterium]